MKTRDDRTAFAQNPRLNLPVLLRWLLVVSVLAGPGYAYAADSDTMCTTTGGSGTVTLNVPPSVSFAPETAPGPGTVLYTSPPYTIDYQCQYGGPTRPGFPLQVAFARLGDLKPLTDALDKAGLELKILLSDSSGGGEVVFDKFTGSPDYVGIGSEYISTGNGTQYTGKRTLTIRLKLTVNKKITPGFYVVPPLSSFRLYAHLNKTGSAIQINTTATRIQYVPNCFVQAGLSTGTVDFGPVITSDVDNNFSLPRTFSIWASTNSDPACGKNQLTGSYEGAGNYYLQLPLKVAFLINSGGTPSSDNKAIILKNENDENNGLQLKISDPAGKFVTFNSESASLPTDSPANKLGEFHDGIFTVNKPYTATLSQAPGIPVKTGKYRTQVTVKVSYY
ncbi:fimbrial protein [Salmonella enterica]